MMGILSTIGKAVSKVTEPISKIFMPTAIVSKFIPQAIPAAVAIEKERPAVTGAVSLLAGGVVAGAAAFPAAAASVTTAVLGAAKSAIPKSTIGKIAVVAAAPVAFSAVTSNPQGAVKAVSSAVDYQVDLGKTLANPSISSAKELVIEHPVAAGLTAAAGLAVVGGGIGLAANTVATVLNTRATRESSAPEQAIATAENTPTAANPLTPSQQIGKEKPIPTDEEIPQTPSTQTISTGKKRIRRHYKKELPQVRQTVRVLVQNRSNSASRVTQKYLNRELLAY